MTPRFLLLLSVCLLVLAGPGCRRAERAPPSPPVRGVLVFLVDTLRPDHLGLYGYERPTSPHIDRLGAEGAVFETCIAQAPWTTPSIASLLSGLRPGAMGLGSFKDPGRVGDAVVTLAERLRAAGWRTHAVTEGGSAKAEFGFDQGFEQFDDRGGYLDRTLSKAQEWLSSLRPDEPFFLFVHTYKVHSYNPRGPFRERFAVPYDGSLLPEPAKLGPFLQDGSHLEQVRRFGEAEWRRVRSLYDGAIAETDAAIGRLVGDLERLGRLDETLFVVTSDHGEELGEHGRSGHGYQPYEESIRVPLVLRHPSLRAARIQEPVRLLDLAPTIAELAGVRPWEEWQGRSLVALLEGGASGETPPASIECAHGGWKALRTRRWKLVADPHPRRLQLFDLLEDPAERTNRVREPAARAVLLRLRRELLRRIREDTRRAARFAGGGGPSAETRREMEALGYVGGGGPAALDDWEELLGR